MRRHLTFANVVSVVALFFALSGGSYAAVSIAGSEEPAATSTTSTSTVFDETVGDVSPDSSNPASGVTVPSQERDEIESEVRPAQAPGRETSEQDEEHGSERSEGAAEESTHDDDEAAPPAWAPAHGHRCQQDGVAPGSAQFVECVHSGHP